MVIDRPAVNRGKVHDSLQAIPEYGRRIPIGFCRYWSGDAGETGETFQGTHELAPNKWAKRVSQISPK